MVSDAVPPSLLPVIDATVAAVASGHPSAGVDTHGAMSCLRDLLWSEVPANSATGGEWLYRLLSAAADRRSPGALELPAGEEGPALLPSLPVQGGGKPKGLAHQTELSALLAEVLGPGCPGSGPARLFIRAVERLLHHIKRRLRPEVGYPAVPRDPDR